ncbi:hypothetical protein [Parabacteroides chinchillae]
MESADPANTVVVQMIPFASTLIRAIVGVSGFLIVMLSMRQGKAFVRSFGDCKAMTAATGGTIFGPFLGVSFSLMAVQYTGAGIASTLMALTPISFWHPLGFSLSRRLL